MSEQLPSTKRNPLSEIVQPFVDLVHAPRALWGVNVGYFLEGLVYFGMLNYLAMYFSDFVFQGVENADVHSHRMVMVLTAGITIAMLVLGFVPDRIGVRPALLIAFVFFLAGRLLIAGAPALGLQPAGLWSPLHQVTMAGILLVVMGYGLYQPASYAAVRQFTSPQTAAMGFAMLYALMNLGGYLPSFAGFVRHRVGMTGTFWVYAALTFLSLICTALILTRRCVVQATDRARQETERIKAQEQSVGEPPGGGSGAPVDESTLPLDFFDRVIRAILRHPLTDLKFTFFIFCLIPVQTLFAYNWLILPQYVERAFRGSTMGKHFELATNLNPLLIFVLVPIVTALTQRAKVYNMMIVGTLVMAVPAFLPALGPSAWTFFGYIFIMTIGEAMWQPRFLQYAAEIAPPGRTGQYMGVAQLPWFLTKFLVPMYSGHMLQHYCPSDGPHDTETMWFIFGCIAMCSTVLLLLARNWLGKDFKTRT